MDKLGLRPSAILKKPNRATLVAVGNQRKVLGATLGTLIALGGAAGICLIAFSAIKARTSAPKGSSEVAALPAAKASPDLPAESSTPAAQYNGVVIEQPASNLTHRETLPPDRPAVDQTSTPALSPSPASAPMSVAQSDRKPSVNDREFLESKPPSAEPKNPEKQLSGAERRNLEKERRQAERKRSRLEEMYQKHEISSEAYKKGTEEYKSQIEKYRAAANAGG